MSSKKKKNLRKKGESEREYKARTTGGKLDYKSGNISYASKPSPQRTVLSPKPTQPEAQGGFTIGSTNPNIVDQPEYQRRVDASIAEYNKKNPDNQFSQDAYNQEMIDKGKGYDQQAVGTPENYNTVLGGTLTQKLEAKIKSPGFKNKIATINPEEVRYQNAVMKDSMVNRQQEIQKMQEEDVKQSPVVEGVKAIAKGVNDMPNQLLKTASEALYSNPKTEREQGTNAGRSLIGLRPKEEEQKDKDTIIQQSKEVHDQLNAGLISEEQAKNKLHEISFNSPEAKRLGQDTVNVAIGVIGGESSFFKNIAKEKSEQAIASMLKGRVAEAEIPAYAKILKNVSKDADVAGILSDAPKPNLASALEEKINQPNLTQTLEESINKESPLIQEARNVPSELKPYVGNDGKITLYHGSNTTFDKTKADYGTFLTANKQEAVDYAKMRASGRGGTPKVSAIKLDPSEVRLNQSTGEFQYIGASKSLQGKYPQEIYKAYNDVNGSNLTAKEIDKLSLDEVRGNASMGLENGAKEFDQLMNKSQPLQEGGITPEILSRAKQINQQALAHQPEFEKQVAEIAKKHGFEVTHGPVKEEGRIAEKVVHDYESDFNQLGDANRSYFTTEKPTAEKIKALAEDVGRLRSNTLYDKEPGYKKAIINIKTPYGEGEIQVTSPEMLDVKLWEEKTFPEGKRMHDYMSKREEVKRRYLEASDLLTARLNSSSEMTPSLRNSALKTGNGLPKEVVAQPSSLTGSKSTRTKAPSTLKNFGNVSDINLNKEVTPNTTKIAEKPFKVKNLEPKAKSQIPAGTRTLASEKPPTNRSEAKTSVPAIQSNAGKRTAESVRSETSPSSKEKYPYTGIQARERKNVKERGFITSTKENEMLPKEVKNFVNGNYTVSSSKEVIQKAKALVRDFPEVAKKIARSNRDDAVARAVNLELISKYSREGMNDEAIDLIEKLSPRATKGGQATEILKWYSKLSPEGIGRFAQRQVDMVNELYPGKDIKLTNQQYASFYEKAKTIQSLTDGYEKDFAMATLLKEIVDIFPSSAVQKVGTLQTMAQLLNPKTLIRNLGGNTMFAGLEGISQTIATPIDKALSLFTKVRTTALPNPVKEVQSFWKGLKQGTREARAGITIGPQTQFDLPQTRVFRDKILGNAEAAMGIALRAPDKAAFVSAFDDSIRASLKANKTNYATQEMIEQATHTGLYRTFQDDSMASRFFIKGKKWMNEIGFKDAKGNRWGLGDLVLKYPKTPGNLLARGIDYSLAGFIKTVFEAGKPLFGKPFNQKAFVDSFSRAIVGTTGLVGMGIALQKIGIITGNPDKDKDVKAMQRLTGTGAYKINVSALKRYIITGLNKDAAKQQEGDTLVSYDWAQPMAVGLSLGARIADKTKNSQSISTTVIDSLSEGANTLQEQPLLSGMKQLFGYGNLLEGGKQIIGGSLSSFVPTLINQFRQVFDNSTRSTYDPSWAKESLNRAIVKVPWLNKILPEQPGVFGDTQETYQNKSNNIFNVFFNPAFVSTISNTPESAMVMDIFYRSGQKQQFPKIVGQSQKVNGVDRELTADEYVNLQKFVGLSTKTLFETMSNNETFMKMSDEDKATTMNSVMTDIGKLGKVEILGDTGDAKSIDGIIEDFNKKMTKAAIIQKEGLDMSLMGKSERGLTFEKKAQDLKETLGKGNMTDFYDKLDNLTPEEQAIFGDIKTSFPEFKGISPYRTYTKEEDPTGSKQRSENTGTFKERLFSTNPEEGIRFFQKLDSEEQKRILDNMDNKGNEEWLKKYNEAQKLPLSSADITPKLEAAANDFYGSIDKELYKSDTPYREAVDKMIAEISPKEQEVFGKIAYGSNVQTAGISKKLYPDSKNPGTPFEPKADQIPTELPVGQSVQTQPYLTAKGKELARARDRVQEWELDKVGRISDQAKENYDKELKNIKSQKEKGLLSDIEYNKMLTNLIEEYAKNRKSSYDAYLDYLRRWESKVI